MFLLNYTLRVFAVSAGAVSYKKKEKKKQAGAASKLRRRGVSCGPSAGHMAEEGTKLTLRRLEAPIHKFIKVALPTDLDRLQKHQSNIQKVTTDFLPY